MSIEKLFIAFWIWHTLEWAYGTFRYRTDHKKYLECREKEIERLNEEIKYWKTVTNKAELGLEMLQKSLLEKVAKGE